MKSILPVLKEESPDPLFKVESEAGTSTAPVTGQINPIIYDLIQIPRRRQCPAIGSGWLEALNG